MISSKLPDKPPNELLGNKVPFLGGLPIRLPVFENLAVEAVFVGLIKPLTEAGEVKLEAVLGMSEVSILSGFDPPLIGMILAGESFLIGGIVSVLSVKSYALLFLDRSEGRGVGVADAAPGVDPEELMEVKDTLTLEVDTLRSGLRPLFSGFGFGFVVVGAELIGVLLMEAVEVTNGTEVTETELLVVSLPFSVTLAVIKKIIKKS